MNKVSLVQFDKKTTTFIYVIDRVQLLSDIFYYWFSLVPEPPEITIPFISTEFRYTFSKYVSGLFGSKISLQYMKKSPVAFSTARLNESAEQNSLTSQFD